MPSKVLGRDCQKWLAAAMVVVSLIAMAVLSSYEMYQLPWVMAPSPHGVGLGTQAAIIRALPMYAGYCTKLTTPVPSLLLHGSAEH